MRLLYFTAGRAKRSREPFLNGRQKKEHKKNRHQPAQVAVVEETMETRVFSSQVVVLPGAESVTVFIMARCTHIRAPRVPCVRFLCTHDTHDTHSACRKKKPSGINGLLFIAERRLGSRAQQPAGRRITSHLCASPSRSMLASKQREGP